MSFGTNNILTLKKFKSLSYFLFIFNLTILQAFAGFNIGTLASCTAKCSYAACSASKKIAEECIRDCDKATISHCMDGAKHWQKVEATYQTVNPLDPSRRLNEVALLTTHNAFSSRAEGYGNYTQQNWSLENQWNHGVRSFMLDIYWYDPSIPVLTSKEIRKDKIKANQALDPSEAGDYLALCHDGDGWSNCAISESVLRMGKKPDSLENWFIRLKTLLDANPTEIAVIHFESYTKLMDEFSARGANELHRLLRETGLASMLVPKATEADYYNWPTIGDMIATNKRLVIITDTEAEFKYGGFIYTKATKENHWTIEGAPNCELREGTRGGDRSNIFVFNHFHAISNGHNYTQDNKPSYIEGRIGVCYAKLGVLPNFVAVDFVDNGADGGAMAVVNDLNSKPAEAFAGRGIRSTDLATDKSVALTRSGQAKAFPSRDKSVALAREGQAKAFPSRDKSVALAREGKAKAFPLPNRAAPSVADLPAPAG